MTIVERWREFERTLRELGREWGLNHAPAQLRYTRPSTHPYGARLDHLLPADYRAFVAEVGYPMVGFSYYDQLGLSFLPPEAMASMSVYLPDPHDAWPEPVAGEPTTCLHAFFAGSDMSDVEGYSFGPATAGGDLVVWQVERGGPVKECGAFAGWLDGEITRLAAHAAGFEPDEDLTEEEAEDEEALAQDPHRVVDYSIGAGYPTNPYSAADLALTWVQGVDASYEFGLVDGDGTWLIPLGMRFREVRPFRDGVAEVVLNTDDPGYGGPWVRIRTDGSPVAP